VWICLILGFIFKRCGFNFMDKYIFKPIVDGKAVNTVVEVVESAEKSIDIIMFDWRWKTGDEQMLCVFFNSILESALARGVVVRAIVNSVEVLKQLEYSHIYAKLFSKYKGLECKMIIVDDKHFCVGGQVGNESVFNDYFVSETMGTDEKTAMQYTNYFNVLWHD